MVVAAEQPERLHLRVAWLCGVVLFLEGYDIAAVGYAIPSLVDAWRVAPSAFTQVLTAGNIGLLLGSLGVGLLGDQLRRKPVLLSCVRRSASSLCSRPLSVRSRRWPACDF